MFPRCRIHAHGGGKIFRIAIEIGAKKPAIPIPSVMVHARGVHSDEAVTSAKPFNERLLLPSVERFADIGRADEKNHVVIAELIGSKRRWILRYIHVEAVLSAELHEP